MTTSLSFSGTMQLQPTDASRPSPIPIEFLLAYTQKSMLDLVYLTAQTNTPVCLGTITQPRAIYIEVDEGTFDLKWDTDVATVPTRLSMDMVPVPESKACLLLFTPVSATRTLFVTTPGAAKGRIWLFQ